MIVVVLAASFIPAWQASRLDPKIGLPTAMMIGGPHSARTGHQVRCDLRYSFGLRKQPKVSDGDEVMRIRVAGLPGCSRVRWRPPRRGRLNGSSSHASFRPRSARPVHRQRRWHDEHPLALAADVDYDAAWSADGAWIALHIRAERIGRHLPRASGWIRSRTADRQSRVRRSGGLLARWPADRLRDDACRWHGGSLDARRPDARAQRR